MTFWEVYLVTALAVTVALMVKSQQVDRLNEKSIIEYMLAALMWPVLLMHLLTDKR